MSKIEMPGSLQLKIMRFIWKNGPSLVANILADINKDVTDEEKLAYTTVLTVTRNLVKKNYLSVNKVKLAHTFSAVLTREEFLKGVTESIKSDLFESGNSVYESKEEFFDYFNRV